MAAQHSSWHPGDHGSTFDVQGVFSHWYSPKKLRYGKPSLDQLYVPRNFKGSISEKNTLYVEFDKLSLKAENCRWCEISTLEVGSINELFKEI